MKVVIDSEKEEDNDIFKLVMLKDEVIRAMHEIEEVFGAFVNDKGHRLPKEYAHLLKDGNEVTAEVAMEILMEIYTSRTLHKLTEI